ncbi:Exosome complex component RRP41-like isoform E [Glycine soja]|nr:Exosome complex component RRP41-like isoform E [Glycine soja]
MQQIRAEIGAVSKADGSSIFEMGNTEVTAAVYGPREVQNRSQQISSHALVRCEYSLANFSTGDRMRKSKGDSAGGADVTLGILPKLDKVTLLQMDSKLPIDILENVMQLAIEGCKAIAIALITFVIILREVKTWFTFIS